MKFKFKKSVLLVLFLIVNSYADSTVWLKPSDKVCKKNKGNIDKQGCKATRVDAKSICLASGGSLASLEQLKQIAIDCGGKINTYYLGDSARFNSSNNMYQSCYKGKGFSSGTYWSLNSSLNFPLSVIGAKAYDAYTICVKSDKELDEIKKSIDNLNLDNLKEIMKNNLNNLNRNELVEYKQYIKRTYPITKKIEEDVKMKLSDKQKKQIGLLGIIKCSILHKTYEDIIKYPDAEAGWHNLEIDIYYQEITRRTGKRKGEVYSYISNNNFLKKSISDMVQESAQKAKEFKSNFFIDTKN